MVWVGPGVKEPVVFADVAAIEADEVPDADDEPDPAPENIGRIKSSATMMTTTAPTIPATRIFRSGPGVPPACTGAGAGAGADGEDWAGVAGSAGGVAGVGDGAGAGGASGRAFWGACGTTGAPQFSQNFMPSATCAPQFPQVRGGSSFALQFSQNLSWGETGALHFGQRSGFREGSADTLATPFPEWDGMT